MQALLDQCAETFRQTLARRSGPLPVYFSFYSMQRALWNWGSERYARHADGMGLRQAAFLVSRIACLKLASLPEPFAPPSAGRDYWDRLFSLAAGDRPAFDAHSRHMPADARRGYNSPNRLHRLLDAAMAGRGLRPGEVIRDFDRMKPLYRGALEALVGIADRDADRVRYGLLFLTASGGLPSQSLAWVKHRDVLCPAAFGIAWLAQDALDLGFEAEPPQNEPWWNEALLIPLPETEQLSLLENLNRIAPGLAEKAVELPRSLSLSAV